MKTLFILSVVVLFTFGCAEKKGYERVEQIDTNGRIVYRYDRDNRLVYRAELWTHEGKEGGSYQSFYPNNVIKEMGSVFDGKPTGEQIFFNESGKETKVVLRSPQAEVFAIKFYDDGTVIKALGAPVYVMRPGSIMSGDSVRYGYMTFASIGIKSKLSIRRLGPAGDTVKKFSVSGFIPRRTQSYFEVIKFVDKGRYLNYIETELTTSSGKLIHRDCIVDTIWIK
jgi:hypothetical protein